MDEMPFVHRSAISFSCFNVDHMCPFSRPALQFCSHSRPSYFSYSLSFSRCQCRVSCSLKIVVRNLFFNFVIHFITLSSVKKIQKCRWKSTMERLHTLFIVSFSVVAPTLSSSQAVWCISLKFKAWIEACNKLRLSLLTSLCYTSKLWLAGLCLQFWLLLDGIGWVVLTDLVTAWWHWSGCAYRFG